MCLLLSLYLFVPKNSQWRSCADLVLILNIDMKIGISLFWTQNLEYWGSGQGPGLAHMCWPCTWKVIIGIISNLFNWQCYFLICQKYLKTQR